MASKGLQSQSRYELQVPAYVFKDAVDLFIQIVSNGLNWGKKANLLCALGFGSLRECKSGSQLV